MNGCAAGLALIERLEATEKWAIAPCYNSKRIYRRTLESGQENVYAIVHRLSSTVVNNLEHFFSLQSQLVFDCY